MGTVNAPEKGLIGKRVRYVFILIVIANVVTKFFQYLYAHGLLK